MTPARDNCNGVGGGGGGDEALFASSSSSMSTVPKFGKGRGYTEEDFGRSFPSMWIWIQTVSYPQHPGMSLFVSVARLPILGFGVPGFTAAVWHNLALYPFATRSGAIFEDMRASDDEVYCHAWRATTRRHRLEITVNRRNILEVLLFALVNSSHMPLLSCAVATLTSNRHCISLFGYGKFKSVLPPCRERRTKKETRRKGSAKVRKDWER
jgi:hypothetical protein